MLFGEPGSQKSGFALWYTQEMALPTLYFSMDMSAFQVSLRLASYRTGQTTEQIEESIANGESDFYLNRLQDSNTTFCYDSHPNLDEMEEMLEAYVEAYDAWPEVVVIDNLMDVEADREDENGSLKEIMAWGHDLTRLSGAAVLVLHHAREGTERSKPGKPHPRKDIVQKVAQKPELILSCALDEWGFYLACVKQRMGPQWPSGEIFTKMRCDADHNRFYKF